MKIKMRCDEAFSHLVELQEVLSKNDVKYPAAAIIHGRRNLEKLKTELAEYIKVKDDFIKQFGKEKNGNYSIDVNDRDAMKKFSDAMKEYNEVEIELEITAVPMEKFESIVCSPDDIIPFDFMIEE